MIDRGDHETDMSSNISVKGAVVDLSQSYSKK